MNERDLQNAINAIRQELNEKVGKRDLLNMRIMQLEQNLKGLRSLMTEERLTEVRRQQTALIIGVSEAIRTIMRAESRPMNGAEVKRCLSDAGFDLGRFKNPSAVVHNTLARMAMTEELSYDPRTKKYSLTPENTADYAGGVPNPWGKNLNEMLKKPK